MAKPPIVLPLPGLAVVKDSTPVKDTIDKKSTDAGLTEELLPSALSRETPQPASQANAASPQPLWLALVFPQLALETSFKQQQNSSEQQNFPDQHFLKQQNTACVLVKEHKGRAVVHSASKLAQAQGIKVDMPVNAAYALSPGLKVYPFEEHLEANRLQQLAVWAEQFTSRVSIQSPRALLLEVRGSIKLFGGLQALQDHIDQQLSSQWQHSYISAITPTPMASLLLAHSGYSEVITHKNALRSVLGRLSVNHLPIGLKKKQQLRSTGVRLLRDLFRLPKEALARRFGARLTNYLDRALGIIPDPLDFFTSSETFEAFYEFPLEVHRTDLVSSIAGQLLEQLALFLRERDICINQCEFRLHHDQHSATTVIVGVRQASRDAQHLLALFKEQLERLQLKAATKSITLSAHDFLPFTVQDETMPGLFAHTSSGQPAGNSQNNIDYLLEQLQARLGRDAIKKVYSVNDHRPEYACCFDGNAQKQKQSLNQQRPLWLLPQPQPLPQKYNRPWLGGPLNLLKGPERIEAGWWSGDDVRRDYYIAIDKHGSHLWVFQEFKRQQWYLHGIFA